MRRSLLQQRGFTRVLAALTACVAVVLSLAAANASTYSGTHFGAGNIPDGCRAEMGPMTDYDEEWDEYYGDPNPAYWLGDGEGAICHHMRTDMNGLDSPEVDVLILVPASPLAERDMRMMRQSIEMWEAGIDFLATRMELDWLARGMNFHVTVDVVDPTGDGGEFTTYPIVDPEIVVVATNPVGGIGIGVDPIDFSNDLMGLGDGEGMCHGIQNPFDFEYWENLPGFDSHHQERSGTYVEDCDGAGGNICFAVNGAVEPWVADPMDFNLFDLVSHEVGHCLTIGHVGDGAEGDWAGLPSNDIMAYHSDPPGLYKCVSTLDVEGIATVMSRYLDVNGDGVVNEDDHLLANDRHGDGRDVFQVQHPDDHFYASATGDPMDCPQPDDGPVPGERTDWTPGDDDGTA